MLVLGRVPKVAESEVKVEVYTPYIEWISDVIIPIAVGSTEFNKRR